MGTAVLRTQGLGLTIGGNRIVDDLDLEVRDGEFLAVIGPNGAGKTSTFNLLTGLYAPTSGRIELSGHDITHDRPHVRARRGMGRSFQVTSVFPSLTVLENVRLAAQAHLGGSLRFWHAVRGHDAATERAARALARVGLQERHDAVASSLSHGDKRTLELAIVLATEPRVLLLDEPTAGMSAEDIPGLVALVREVQADGTTVVMVEHRMDVVVEVADRIAVMHHGALLACDTPAAVMADATVQSAYLGDPL
jgi:branched-chain amino acid transport system ATP-binding protein